MQGTIQEFSQQIRRGAMSPVELTRQCLSQVENLNPGLNAFITVTAAAALQAAQVAEREIREGNWRGPLHGIPLGLKDIIDTAGTRTTAASAQFRDRVPAQDAEVVRRLNAAGAVILGKQNLHEFAYGASSVIGHFGEVRNPWNPAQIAGGSSSGSAASVAAGLGLAAIGTDTAGSIRFPAALCGVTGLKPTYGRVSARGVVPLSWSLDHVGPLARSVEDCAIVLQAIAGYDPEDIASVNRPAGDYVARLKEEPRKLRVGLPRSYFFEDLDKEIAAATENALTVIRSLVAEIRDISIPVSGDRSLQGAESYAFHAAWVASSPELYDPETLRRIRSGEHTAVAEYIRSRRQLDQVRRNACSLFEDIDLLVMPTSPVQSSSIAELRREPGQLRARELEMLRNTRPLNVWGLPAISVPCGFTEAGMPIGLQICGAPWREDLVLNLAWHYEQATAWHKRTPAICR